MNYDAQKVTYRKLAAGAAGLPAAGLRQHEPLLQPV